jgi:hypothetical protein
MVTNGSLRLQLLPEPMRLTDKLFSVFIGRYQWINGKIRQRKACIATN